jgi:endoglucanase
VGRALRLSPRSLGLIAAGVVIMVIAGVVWLVGGASTTSAGPGNLAGGSASAEPGAPTTAGAPAATTPGRPSASTGPHATAGPSTSAGHSSSTGSSPAVPLFRDPSSSAASWVAANPSDSRAAVIRDRIVSQPQARWFTPVNVSSARQDAASYVDAANAAGQVPVLAVYGITDRDCGGASSGGAADLSQYRSWITNLASGLGSHEVIIILEPDSIALQSCLSASDVTARDQALSTATQTIKSANAQAKVYLDGGHSRWNSAGDQAQRLEAAGVQRADGFYTNVSNFNSTATETAYGQSVIADLRSAGVAGKHQVIDTSRNGGSAGANGDWCADDNTDRRLGQRPTLSTGQPNIDGYLWVKRPGEADGCAFGAGSFQPTLAVSLAG